MLWLKILSLSTDIQAMKKAHLIISQGWRFLYLACLTFSSSVSRGFNHTDLPFSCVQFPPSSIFLPHSLSLTRLHRSVPFPDLALRSTYVPTYISPNIHYYQSGSFLFRPCSIMQEISGSTYPSIRMESSPRSEPNSTNNWFSISVSRGKLYGVPFYKSY